MRKADTFADMFKDAKKRVENRDVPIVVLGEGQVLFDMDAARSELAICCSARLLCMPLEGPPTVEEILAMAEFVLMASQRLAAIQQITNRGIADPIKA